MKISAFGRWAPARPSTKRFVFVRLVRLVDGRLRAHRPNASFSAWDGHLKGGNQKNLRGFAPQIFLVDRFFPTLDGR